MKNLHKLMAKKMDRKEFLLYIGLFLLAVTGISGLWKNLTDFLATQQHPSTHYGFGSSPYGGLPKKGNR